MKKIPKKQIRRHAKSFIGALDIAKENGDLSPSSYKRLKKDFLDDLKKEGVSRESVE